jgi:hypothetical protein
VRRAREPAWASGIGRKKVAAKSEQREAGDLGGGGNANFDDRARV